MSEIDDDDGNYIDDDELSDNNSAHHQIVSTPATTMSTLLTSSIKGEKEKGELIIPSKRRSAEWENFKVWSNANHLANCKICGEDVDIGKC